jgi:hypothetical protein
MSEEFKPGDAVVVELTTHDRGNSSKYTTWKPATFDRYDGARIWVVVKTPMGPWKRSFPSVKVRRATNK